VPVGTQNCGIPTAIGDTGFYVDYNDVDKTVTAIRMALVSEKGANARKRIIKLFKPEMREQELKKIVSDRLEHVK
jgi:glycosyltransferase involved in cell wall biosynthesis